jgi:hypothetical protein
MSVGDLEPVAVSQPAAETIRDARDERDEQQLMAGHAPGSSRSARVAMAHAVVDASVVVDLLVEHPCSDAVRAALESIDGVAPALLDAEVL